MLDIISCDYLPLKNNEEQPKPSKYFLIGTEISLYYHTTIDYFGRKIEVFAKHIF